MERKDGKRSFYVHEKSGKKIVPTGSKMSSAGPSSAAKKAAMRLAKESGKETGSILIREAGRRDRVRRYEFEIVPEVLVEPNNVKINRGIKGKKETFTGEEPEFIARNEYFQKHDLNPVTKVAWTEADATERNATLIDGKIVLNPGEHIVLRARKAIVHFIEVQKLPEGTELHLEKPEKPEAPAKEKKAKKAKAEDPAPETPKTE